MNRWLSFRAGVVLAAVAMSVGGCQCPEQPPTCDTTDLTVAFDTPSDGAMVEQSSNVKVSLSRNGGPVNIGTAKLEVRGPGATEFGGALNGTLDGANATFMSVMLAAGENALRATVAEANCTGAAAPVTIVVTAKSNVTPPPVVTMCQFPQDTNADGRLNAAELPLGTAVQLKVTTTNGSGATLSATGSNPASAPIMNETATISVPGPADAFDGTFTVGGVVVSRGSQTAMCPTTPSIQIARVPGCTIENTTSLTPRGPFDDANTQQTGFQIRATAQLNSGSTATAEFVNGQETAMVTFAAGMGSADFTVPTTGTQTYNVVLRGTDSNGNPCTVVNATRAVVVDFEPPAVTITAPANGATITTPTATVTASVTGADGQSCQLFVDGVMNTTATVANGTVSMPVSFPDSRAYSLRVECVDAAQNRGSSATTLTDGGSAETVVTVQLPSNICSVTFASIGGETSCPAFVTRLNAGALPVTLTRSSNCPTQPVRLFKDTTAVAGTGPSFSVVVGAATASFTLRAEIDNLPGATPAVTSVSCAVDVNTNRPAITNPVAPVTGPAIINAAADTQPQSAGAQRLLSFTAAVPPMGRVDVCVDSATIAGVGAAACAGTSGWFTLSSNVVSPVAAFTFPEGTYQVKIVVVGGAGAPQESDPVPVFVDVTTPCVASSGIILPQDGAADGGVGDNNLNLAELGANPPAIRFALDTACGSAATATVRAVVSGAPGNPSYAPVVNNPTGVQNLQLTQNVGSEQNLDIFVELTDAAGNVNRLSTNPSARKAFRVDTVVPSCTFLAPATGRTLNLTDIPAGSVDARVQSATDVSLVQISEGAGSPQFVAPNTSGVATASFTVSGTRTLNFSATCRDDAGNTAPVATRSVDIDLDAPSFVLSAPTSGFSSVTTSVVTTATMVTGANGNPIVIRSSAQGTDIGTLTSAGGYTATLVYPVGANQTITARVVDSAGNEAVQTATNVTVTSTTCQIALAPMNGSAPFARGATTWLNRSHVPGAGASSGTATIQANSSNCRSGQAVTLARVSPAGGPTIAPVNTATNGDVSFPGVTVADGDVWSLTITNNPTPTQFSVDLVAPQFSAFRINADTAAPPAAVYFVAATNNERVKNNTAGYYPDQDSNTGNGAQAAFTFTGVSGAANGTVEITIGSTQVIAPQAVTSSMQTFTSVAGSLPHNTTGTLAAVVIDEGGNVVDAYRGPAVVDIVPPSAPTGQDAGVVDARGATGSIAWLNDALDDVGTPGSGAPARYVVKWTTSSVNGNNGMATSDDFFGASSSDAIERAPTGTAMSESISLPPLNTYFLAVRARDEVFNYSTFAGPLARDNFWTQAKLSGASGTSFGNAVSLQSSLNNDSVLDLVVGAASSGIPGAVFVYYGGTGFASQPSCVSSPACQSITSPDGVGNGFGFDFSAAGNAGDPSGGSPKPDLLVAQNNFPTSSAATVGRAILYFGTDSGSQLSTSGFIEFRGADNAGRIGNIAKIIPDLNGDGLAEVLFGAPFANSNNGLVFIYAGRSQSAWQAARTQTDPTTLAPFIPVSSATATWTIAGGAVTPTPSTGYFGRSRFSVANLGDLDGDGRGDISIGLGPETINRFQLWTSATISSATGTIPNTSRLQDISQAPGTNGNVNQGLGAFISANVNILNGSAQDLVVTWPARAGGGSVFIYADLSSVGAPVTPSYTITGPLQFGSAVGVVSLNTGDSRPDLVVGGNFSTNAFAWIFWQQAGATPFESTTSGTGFWMSKFDGNAITGLATNSLGRSNAVGDIDGDSRPDVILADEVNNAVYVWR